MHHNSIGVFCKCVIVFSQFRSPCKFIYGQISSILSHNFERHVKVRLRSKVTILWSRRYLALAREQGWWQLGCSFSPTKNWLLGRTFSAHLPNTNSFWYGLVTSLAIVGIFFIVPNSSYSRNWTWWSDRGVRLVVRVLLWISTHELFFKTLETLPHW